MTATELARDLHILPQAAYRAARPLVKFGCIDVLGRRPVRFRAKMATESLNALLYATREWFESTVQAHRDVEQTRSSENGSFNMSFITNREDLVEHVTRDTRNAMLTLNLIVSGLEVPAETILENKRAIDRGVRIRILVQRQDVNKEMLTNWRRMGINVRLCPSIDARIITIDDRITYLTSFDPNEKEEGVGVRFDYPPIAQLMNDIFEDRWRAGQET